MSDSTRLPDLPLVLAGLPRGVRDVLRTAGVPAKAVPECSLEETGRFVLFDSRRSRSAQQARAAMRLGLKTIDVAECHLPEEDVPLSGSQATHLVTVIKEQLETQGGVWVRIGDYPFPFESVLCVSVEHDLDELADLARIRDLLPGTVTHFVPTRLRGEFLTYASLIGSSELGWLVTPEELLDSPRKTRTHWATRKERFTEAGLPVRGLFLAERDLELPGVSALAHIGLTHACRDCGVQGGTVRCESEWLNLGTVTVDALAAAAPVGPPRFASESRQDASTILAPTSHFVAENEPLPPAIAALQALHRQGRPVFIHDNARDGAVAAQLLLLRGAATRLSLMWQTTCGEFTQWWSLRQNVELKAWQTAEGCTIQTTGDLEDVPRSLEVWRGEHRAVLPLVQSNLSVRDDGVAYVHTPDRSPAGLAGAPERPAQRRSTADIPTATADSWAA